MDEQQVQEAIPDLKTIPTDFREPETKGSRRCGGWFKSYAPVNYHSPIAALPPPSASWYPPPILSPTALTISRALSNLA